MIELFFVTCLLTDPARCEDHSLLFLDQNGLMSCMIQAQSELVRWVEVHPNDHIREWKCRVGGNREMKI